MLIPLNLGLEGSLDPSAISRAYGPPPLIRFFGLFGPFRPPGPLQPTFCKLWYLPAAFDLNSMRPKGAQGPEPWPQNDNLVKLAPFFATSHKNSIGHIWPWSWYHPPMASGNHQRPSETFSQVLALKKRELIFPLLDTDASRTMDGTYMVLYTIMHHVSSAIEW
ncbi:hypothetical protein O181_048495 [Austropuccinia psidii MF-1]|uniref:Uncharacterized protein n=1 Tax=Austropuccinia psidii MF-1 TaxID=1389203 RepID=A0A9Q3HP91_9BASI|nr:hypothetical protein [Austropuccinia psidii MF-1]